MTRQPGSKMGLGRSDSQLFTIPSGANGSAVTPLDFGRGHTSYIIKCADASKIPATTTLSVKVSYDDADAEVDLFVQNGGTAKFATPNLPTSGTFGFQLLHAYGAQKLRFILSNNATGGNVVLEVMGFEPTLDDV